MQKSFIETFCTDTLENHIPKSWLSCCRWWWYCQNICLLVLFFLILIIQYVFCLSVFDNHWWWWWWKFSKCFFKWSSLSSISIRNTYVCSVITIMVVIVNTHTKERKTTWKYFVCLSSLSIALINSLLPYTNGEKKSVLPYSCIELNSIQLK